MNNISAESISAYQAAITRQNLGTSVLAKANEAAKAEGQAVVALIESPPCERRGGRTGPRR